MLKKTTVLIVLLLGLLLLASTTFAGGGDVYELSIDEWLYTGSPRVYEQSILIPSTMELNVEAGVEVHMAPGTEIIVEGQLIIHEDDEQKLRVRFRSADDASSWSGIRVMGNGDDKGSLKSTTIINATNGLIINNSIFEINNVEILSTLGNQECNRAITINEGSNVSLNNVNVRLNSASATSQVFSAIGSEINLIDSEFFHVVHVDLSSGHTPDSNLNPMYIVNSSGNIDNFHLDVISNIETDAATFKSCSSSSPHNLDILNITEASVKLEIENADGFSSAFTVSEGYIEFDAITIDLRAVNSNVAGFHVYDHGRINVINTIISNTKGQTSATELFLAFIVNYQSPNSFITCDYSCLFALNEGYSSQHIITDHDQISYGDNIVIEDPIFDNPEDFNYFLEAESPCIDAGIGGVDPDNTVTDIGKSFYYQDFTSVNEGSIPETFNIVSVYPNPFNSTTKIGMNLNRAEMVSVVIFDVLGREVQNIHSAPLDAGHHEFIWSASPGVASGIYFLKVEAGSNREIQKLTYIR
jgi:Secretion system C-terminal sorting domain